MISDFTKYTYPVVFCFLSVTAISASVMIAAFFQSPWVIFILAIQYS